jgi:serine/threonine-protein kinase
VGCPDENVLAEYVDNVLAAAKRQSVAQHLDACAACRTIVSDLARMQHAADDEKTIAEAMVSNTTIDVHRERASHIVPGTMIGEYEVKSVLGAGGMGVVFAAVHPRIGKKAAIKILKKDLARDPSAIVRFENEARAVNEIGHPNIVDIFSFGELPNGDPYYVMEHVDGQSLHDWIHSHGPVSLDVAMPILRQICGALSAAHSRGIIHRDLKPGNIMVAGSEGAPRVKVLDFGLAKMMRTDDVDADELTHPGIPIGTPAFMSPEQFMGQEVDQRTDVYALGVLMYQMLTGTYPFQGATPSEIGEQHLYHTPRNPSAIVNLPERVDQIMEKALAKEPVNRYATVQDLRRDLERCLEDQRTTMPRMATPAPAPAIVAPPSTMMSPPPTMVSPPPTMASPPVVAARSHIGRWLGLTGAAAAIAFAVVFVIASGSKKTPPPAANEQRIEMQAAPSTPVAPAAGSAVAAEVPTAAPPTTAPPLTTTTSATAPTTDVATTQDTPKQTSRAAKQTTKSRVTKPVTPPKTETGEDDDRMLLEGGAVKRTP